MDIYEARRLAVQALITERYGGSQSSFGADVGLSSSYLSRMLKREGEEGRKRIGEDMALRIETKLDLEPGALLNAATALAAKLAPNLTKRRNDFVHTGKGGSVGDLLAHHDLEQRLVGKVALAVMDVRASMGLGVDQPSHEEVVMSMVVDETWLRRHANFSNPNNLGILTGIGDSMQPTFEDGDPLLIDRAVNEVKLDAIYVISLNDRLYIKRLQQRPNGSYVMISDNKSYESYVITDREREKFQVLGRVVMVWNARKI